MRSILLDIITKYDIQQQEQISYLTEKVTRLEAENSRLVFQAADNVTKNDQQKLRDIIGGVYDMVTPTDSQQKLLGRMTKMFLDLQTAIPACKIHLSGIEFRMDYYHQADHRNASFHWNGKEFLQK